MIKAKQFKLVYKNMIGNNTLKEGTFDEIWKYLIETEGDKPLQFINNTYEIKLI